MSIIDLQIKVLFWDTKTLEIREYAYFLGMELPEDNDLLYIAREGLMAPLPESW